MQGQIACAITLVDHGVGARRQQHFDVGGRNLSGAGQMQSRIAGRLIRNAGRVDVAGLDKSPQNRLSVLQYSRLMAVLQTACSIKHDQPGDAVGVRLNAGIKQCIYPGRPGIMLARANRLGEFSLHFCVGGHVRFALCDGGAGTREMNA